MPIPRDGMEVWGDPEPTPSEPIIIGGQGREPSQLGFDAKVAWRCFLLAILLFGAAVAAAVL